MENEFVLGIDIGGTYTKIGLVDQAGHILKMKKFATGAKMPFEHFIKAITTEIAELRKEIKPSQLLAVGIGAPNANAETGNMENPPNFRWGKTVPIVTTLKKLFQLPISLTNDANAAALGELKFGMGKGLKHFVVLTLGTGLGCGIIAEGNLWIGAHGMAGELGHVNVKSGSYARQCNCGLKGCLETYVSVTGMRRTIFELIAKMSADSSLRNISFEEMTGEIISEAALNGDTIAMQAFKQTGEILGVQLADTAAHLDPEAFILLGGLSKAGDILLKPTLESMEQNLFVAYKNKIKILISKTPSDHAVLGPAALAWKNL